MKRFRSLHALPVLLLLALGCLSKPSPGPGPNPTPRQLAAVVMVLDENRSEPISSGHAVAINARVVQEYLDSHCAKASDGATPESKRYGKKVDLQMQSPVVQKLHAAVVGKMADSRDPNIGIAVTDRRFVIGKIPEGFESDGKTPKLLTLLKKYGGE